MGPKTILPLCKVLGKLGMFSSEKFPKPDFWVFFEDLKQFMQKRFFFGNFLCEEKCFLIKKSVQLLGRGQNIVVCDRKGNFFQTRGGGLPLPQSNGPEQLLSHTLTSEFKKNVPPVVGN